MKAPSMQLPRRSSVLANLALFGVSVLFSLILAELLARAVLGGGTLWRWPNYVVLARTPDPEHVSQMHYDAELGYEPVPGYRGRLVGKPISFDARGLREHDLGGPAPSGPSILAIGDSFTEGYLVGNDETWSSNLQRVTGRPVLNGGVRAYGIDQIVLRAERIVPQLKPDTVILGFIPDDIDRTELYTRDNRPKPYFVPSDTKEDGLELRNVPVPLEPPPLSGWRSLAGYSFLAHALMTRFGFYEIWYGVSRHAHRDGLGVSCRLMDRFARLMKKTGAKPLVVAFYEDSTWRYQRVAEFERGRVAAVLACAKRAGMDTLDTWDGMNAAGMPAKAATYYSGGHFTDAGANVAARLIADKLPK